MFEETIKTFYAAAKFKYGQVSAILEPIEIEVQNIKENIIYFLSHPKHHACNRNKKSSNTHNSLQILENYWNANNTMKDISLTIQDNINISTGNTHKNTRTIHNIKEDLITYSRYIWVEKEDTKNFREGTYVKLRYGITILIQKKIYMNDTFKILAIQVFDKQVGGHSSYFNNTTSLINDYQQNVATNKSTYEIPWLSFEDQPVWMDFYLYNKWYLGGPINESNKHLQIQCYRGLVDESHTQIMNNYAQAADKSKLTDLTHQNNVPILIRHLGWFMYDHKQTNRTGVYSMNLIDPFYKIK